MPLWCRPPPLLLHPQWHGLCPLSPLVVHTLPPSIHLPLYLQKELSAVCMAQLKRGVCFPGLTAVQAALGAGDVSSEAVARILRALPCELRSALQQHWPLFFKAAWDHNTGSHKSLCTTWRGIHTKKLSGESTVPLCPARPLTWGTWLTR